ncbi:MAG: folate-binding protein YgfZ [Alphaproteobacteria bacterium]|nr:folate-binding protein YgfZ [Alphaproteobacteria bacterium]
MSCVALPHRSLVRIAGQDAQTLLQDVISCDVDGLPASLARVGALLTPQGKILFEFLISRTGDNGFLFDLDADQVGPFIQRMTMYKLRAKADIERVESTGVAACWDCDPAEALVVDERFCEGSPVYRRYGSDVVDTGNTDEYTRLRIDHGVAEAGRDFEPSEAFPHDVLMDLNKGVSLKKGCFVGQEVVSRMQHRGTARRRIVRVNGADALPEPGTPIQANERAVGQLGTTLENTGLALVRVDRVAKALEQDTPILAGGVPVTLTLPSWTGLQFSPPVSEG